MFQNEAFGIEELEAQIEQMATSYDTQIEKLLAQYESQLNEMQQKIDELNGKKQSKDATPVPCK